MSEPKYDPRHDINYEEIERHLGILFEPEDWIEFRAIRSGRARGTVSCYIQVERFVTDLPAAIRQWLDAHHDDRYFGLYIGANPRKVRASYGPARPSSDADVLSYRCAFADLDNCDPNAALALLRSANLPDPTLIVHSGRSTGTHLYWRFDEAVDEQTWRDIQRAIQKRVNGDMMKDPSRVMRVPGSYNFKRKNNARILREGKSYPTYESLGLSADEMVPPTFVVAEPGVEADERNLNYSTRRYLEHEGIPEGGDEHFDGRNNALFSAACDFIANGFGYEDTCERLLPLSCDRDGLPEYEAKRTISNASTRNPTRTLMVNINGVDETWTRYMERPQYADRGIPSSEDPVESYEGLENAMQRTIRPATDEESIQFAIMRGDADLPSIEDHEEAEVEEREIEEPGTTTDLTEEEAEALRYSEEMDEITQAELSAPPIVSNYEPGILEPEGRGKPKAVKLYRSAENFVDDIRDNFSGWPKYAPGMGLFGYRSDGDLGDEIVHGLPTAPSMFAFLKATGQVRWTSEPTIFQQMGVVRELRPIKEGEAFELLKERCPNRYRGFCQTPHFPAIDGFYYPKYNLPEPSKNFEVLYEFINALNPDTPEDRTLLLASLLTPAWGGPPGARPLFVLSSEHGQGSGKTETVKAISDIWGGYYPLSMEKSWSDNAKALMSSTDWLTRICLWDNVKGRFSSGEIEGAVTSSTIQGHRMYVGTVKRYNDVSFFVTLNNPDMSRDLAQRAIVIKLGKPKVGNFTDWWRSFIAENRRQLIADALAVLGRPSKSFNFGAFPDRWRAWQTGVLAKIPEIDLTKIMETTVARREEVDSETNDGEQIIRAIINYIDETRLGPSVSISQIEIQRSIEQAGLWKVDSRSTDAQNSRRMGNYVRSRTSALGFLSRLSKGFLSVDDRGTPIARTSERATSRSPKWILDYNAAKDHFGDDFGIESFGSSEPDNSGDPDDGIDIPI